VLGVERLAVRKSCSKLSGLLLTCVCLLAGDRIAGFDTDGLRAEAGWRIQTSVTT
jgi:hypothetical protein